MARGGGGGPPPGRHDPDTPWGRQASRFLAAVLAETDEPFVAVHEVDAASLGWSDDTWMRVDDVADRLLAQAPNPLPRSELRIEEGTPDAADDTIGRDGYVLLIAVQPGMKETLARLVGAAGEVTRFSGFMQHLDATLGDADPDPITHHDTVDPALPAAGESEQPGEDPDDRRAVMVGKQNRVNVAFLLVDRHSGRFVAAHGARLEPIMGPRGDYRGSIQAALRQWRLEGEPWTAALFTGGTAP